MRCGNLQWNRGVVSLCLSVIVYVCLSVSLCMCMLVLSDDEVNHKGLIQA